MNRRTILALAVSPWPVHTLRASSFWNDKAPARWSEQEVEQILTDSPWARQVEVKLDPSNTRGGSPPGRMPGEGGPDGKMPSFKALVRWESAVPVQVAVREPLPDDSANRYVISVTGLPCAGGRLGPGIEGDPSYDRRREQLVERVRSATLLRRRGGSRIEPVQFQMARNHSGMLVRFARPSKPIQVDEKEIAFETRIGPFEIKAKFKLEEMLWKGVLSL